MTTVANAISALLYSHNTVIVPGLGAFLCQVEGAKVNVITNQFEKPSAILSFDPLQREENDLVVNYLAANDGITVEEARQQVAEFVSEIFAKLRTGETADIPEVGSLSYGDDQEIVFNAVASNDYNGDAFGLDDLTPQPVYSTESRTQETEPAKQPAAPQKQPTEPPKQENAQEEQKTESEPESGTSDDDHHRHNYWIWILILVLVAAGVALWYFKFRPTPSDPGTKPVVKTNDTVAPGNDTVTPCHDTLTITNDSLANFNDSLTFTNDSLKNVNDSLVNSNDTTAIANDSVAQVIDTVKVNPQNPPTSNDHPVEVVSPDATSKAFIVGGCFSVEKNALKMVMEAREQGCAGAFVMKRGSKFYVCYGQYPSTADAKAALPEVLSNYNARAWILTK